MFNKKIFYIIIIVTSTLFISYLHYSTIPEIYALHDIYIELYYIPALLGALLFGLRGAIMAYLLGAVLYLPYVFVSWTGIFLHEINRLLHFLLTGLFALLTGLLVDRERRNREQLEKERYLAGIGQVATTIVHDLKNPLITILAYARRIKEGKGSVDIAIDTITDAAQDMQKIVHDVLDFAKPIRLELKQEDIRDVINRACDFCKTKAEEKGVILSINFPAEPVNILIDSFHMERALTNLISNAIEASSKGQNITIKTVADKNYLSMRIKDQGSGMDKETLENMFIPFYTKKSGGTGLGMPIAKKVIEGHQGKIRVESQPGMGTEVTIELPYRLKIEKE